jgi:integrase
MASVTKTPSGTWKALVRKRGYVAEIKTFRTKRDADDWARGVEDEMVRGMYIRRSNAERLTVSAALDRYVREVAPTKKASTQDREKGRYETLRAFFGDYSLVAVTPELVAKFRDKRLEVGLASNTVRLDLALLGHLYVTVIREWGIGLTYNPVQLIRKPSPGAARDRRLTTEEESRLRAAVAEHSNPMLRWIVTIAIETGMRLSEIVTLTRDQVELRRRIIRLSETKNGSPRTVPMTTTAADAMREALANPVRPIDTDLVFFGEPGQDGRRRPYVFNRTWQRIVKQLGIVDFRFHDLRHEAVSRFVEAGLSDQEVAAISGHKSMQMLKRYTHLRAEDLVIKLDLARAAR